MTKLALRDHNLSFNKCLFFIPDCFSPKSCSFPIVLHIATVTDVIYFIGNSMDDRH